MKRFSNTSLGHSGLLLSLLAAVLGCTLPMAADQSSALTVEPSIEAIRVEGTNVVVTVFAPASLKRLALETRQRLGDGGWVTRDFAWPEGQGGEFTFRLPNTKDVELIRVKGDDATTLPLPASFYRGQSVFEQIRVAQTTGSNMTPNTGGASENAGGDSASLYSPAPATPSLSSTAIPVGRSVVESDIWQVDGDTVYFFNQNRGLQIIDVSDPDHPRILGQLPMAAVGEQMYLLPAGADPGVRHVALLTREGCTWNQSAVVLVKVVNGVPTLQERLSMLGNVTESRLVGSALYVATQGWYLRTSAQPTINNGLPQAIFSYYETTTAIASFDLSNPEAPVTKPRIELAVSPNAIQATDTFLFLAVSGSQYFSSTNQPPWVSPGTHSVLLFDISAANGDVSQKGYVSTAGFVADKFKMNLKDGVLSVVSQTQPGWTSTGLTPTVTQLETFSLANPNAPQRLAALPIITNETVFATRYDGDRAYIVTFRQVDPLWIVDLKDPAKPVIRGELQVPGWSSYIHPMGDRLLAVGQETWSKPSISLYDVADATQPKLLQRVLLGEWAWSEASNDEKAFKVFPDEGLILVPWSGQRASETTPDSMQYFQGMQLLDFDRDSLTKRGVIDHALQARRATLQRNRILSLSGTELITATYTNRDNPQVTATLNLAPQTDRVFPLGDKLVGFNFYDGTRPAEVHIASKASPDVFLSVLTLSNLQTLGLDLHGNVLQVMQKENDTYHTELVVQTNEQITWVEQPPRVEYKTNETVLWLSQPPLITYVTNWITFQEQAPLKVIGSNLIEIVVQIPPIPGVNEIFYQTNRYWKPVYGSPEYVEVTREEIHKIETPQPLLPLLTNVVTRFEVPQPPLPWTNTVVMTNSISVRDPIVGVLTLIDVAATPKPVVLGSVRFEFQKDFYPTWLTPVWPQPTVAVWGPEGEDAARNYYPFYLTADVMPVRSVGLGGIVAVSDAQIVGHIEASPWYFGATTSPEYLAFDLSNPAAPQLIHRLQPVVSADAGTQWNGTSRVYVSGTKLFFSHTESRFIPAVPTPNTGTKADDLVISWWMPGSYEYSYRLNVADYQDPRNPVIRPPAPLPGVLTGISHAGSLLYAQHSDTNGATVLDALAYDGAQAFLVDTLPIPAVWPQPVRVLGSGHVLLGRAPGTNAEPATLESWRINQLGRFELYGTTALTSAIQTFQIYGDLLAATTTDAQLLLLDVTDPDHPVTVGQHELNCGYWLDLTTAQGSVEDGLWTARNIQGVWHFGTTKP